MSAPHGPDVGAAGPAAPSAQLPGGPGGFDGPRGFDGPGDPYRMGRRSTASLVTVFLLIALGAVSTMVGLPYVVMKPGPITNTLGKLDGTQLITVAGAQSYPTEGALDFTTVRIVGGPGVRVTVWDLLEAAVRPSEDVVDEELYFPKGVTDKQVEEESTAEMVDSQQEAIAVALRAAGRTVTQRLVIAQVAKDSPSASVLKAGDEIVAVDGTRVATSEDIRTAIGKTPAGGTVTLRLRRGESETEVSAKTRESDGRTTIGVFLGVRFDFPIDVKINAGDVGGPSAGTMFALGVYDTITPGALTGGQQVAGTGTIDYTGKVGPIGGIRQKLIGARDGGARWFLAPADNCDEVTGHVPDGLQVVRIGTFDDARKAVEAIGAKRADSLPTCTK